MNERKTEKLVRDKLDKLGYYDDNNIIVEEQESENRRIKNRLKRASKQFSRGGVEAVQILLFHLRMTAIGLLS